MTRRIRFRTRPNFQLRSFHNKKEIDTVLCVIVAVHTSVLQNCLFFPPASTINNLNDLRIRSAVWNVRVKDMDEKGNFSDVHWYQMKIKTTRPCVVSQRPDNLGPNANQNTVEDLDELPRISKEMCMNALEKT